MDEIMLWKDWTCDKEGNQHLEGVDVESTKYFRNCLLEIDQHEDLSFGSITIGHNHNSVIKENEILLSH